MTEHEPSLTLAAKVAKIIFPNSEKQMSPTFTKHFTAKNKLHNIRSTTEMIY